MACWLDCSYNLHCVFTCCRLHIVTCERLHTPHIHAESISFYSEAINVPMIPLGLKETKEVDFTVSIQVKITSRISLPWFIFYQISVSMREKHLLVKQWMFYLKYYNKVEEEHCCFNFTSSVSALMLLLNGSQYTVHQVVCFIYCDIYWITPFQNVFLMWKTVRRSCISSHIWHLNITYVLM